MPAPAHEARTPVERALAWIASRGIDVRPWPEPADQAAPHNGSAVLYVVANDAEAPRCGALEDWVRVPLDGDELYARADGLLARAQRYGPVRVEVDPDGLLRVDDLIVILSPTEAAILGVLVGSIGRLVPRGDLLAATWPDIEAEPRWLAKHIGSLRRRLDGVPLEIHSVRGQGLILERVAPPSD